jgi:hypothetical protein
MPQAQNRERSIQEIAEEIKRSKDGRETLRLSTELLEKAKKQSEEIEKTRDRDRPH